MPEIQAFRAVRYNLGQVGSLSDVIAPPYDVIGPELQDELYRKSPYNVIRLILNKIEPGDDDEANNRYTRAKRFYKDWQSEGVLYTDPDPAIYVYHQEFTAEGVTYNRRGFMARLRLSPFGEGQVFPHEETLPGPKVDRLMLMTTTKANLSQIFGLYPDPANEAQAILDEAISRLTPVVATDHLGVVSKVWAVTDIRTIAAVAAVVGPKPIFIADGHHRYETACEYRRHIYESGFLSKDHPANFVLMMFVGMEDPGLIVMPTHRLFRGLPPMTSEELAARLSPCFTDPAGGPGAGPGAGRLGRHRNGRQAGHDRPVYAEGPALGAGRSDRGRPRPHGRSGQRAYGPMAGTWGGGAPSAADRRPVGRQGSAETPLCPPGAGSGRWAEDGRIPLGGPGHAGHGPAHPLDQPHRASGCRPRAPISIPSCSADW